MSNSEAGINFPLTGPQARSSTVTAKRILADAVRSVDVRTAEQIESETVWRRRYPRYYRRLVEVGLRSPQAAESIAAAGLDALYREMVFMQDGEALGIEEAMRARSAAQLHTAIVEGRGGEAPGKLSLPYGGRTLCDGDLLRQIDDWESRGVIEPSCGEALRRVQEHPEWLDLSDQTIVLLGAAAEMGPFEVLNRWRANIAAVDLNRPQVWQRLIATARAGNGRLWLPTRDVLSADQDDNELASRAGADLIAEAPAIARWIRELSRPVVIGAYAYLDGAMHVRVALAMDAIMNEIASQRPETTLALLHTPSDVFAVSEDAARAAQRSFQGRGLVKAVQEPLRLLSGGHWFRPNVDELIPLVPGKLTGIVDSLVVEQGPNYALAKRLQRWRATTARARGIRVSANIAPGTRTVSVVKNKALAIAYAGAPFFGVEIFEPATSNALMAALLVHDLRHDGAAANPKVPLDHPAELFMQGAVHGGLWRAAFEPRSAKVFAVALGLSTSLTRGRATR